MTRPYGSGSVEPLRSGRFRARVRFGKSDRRTVGVFATREEAEHELDVYLAAFRASGAHPTEGVTLGWLAERTLLRRRQDGYRSVNDDESRWSQYATELAGLPAASLTPADVRLWLAELAGRGLATQTRRNALNVLRAVLRDAVESGLLGANVASGITARDHGRIRETSTHLTESEAGRLVYVSLREHPEIAIAIGSGMRAGEQRSLLHADVHDTHLIVRFGAPGTPTKNGKIRRVPILPLTRLGLEATRELYPGSRLVTPGPSGAPRRHLPSRHTWAAALREAQIGRHVRWHDLRHTCATLLLQGSTLLVPDGRPWSLEAVRDMLGHSSLRVTERYTVHATGTLAEQAARSSIDPRQEKETDRPKVPRAPKNRARVAEVRMGFEPTYDGFAIQNYPSILASLRALADQARVILTAAASRDPYVVQHALDLADAILAIDEELADDAAEETSDSG